MIEPTFGQSVSTAFEFLATVYQDMDAMMKSLKQQLTDAGWEEWYPIKFPWGNMKFIYFGIYAPKGSRERVGFRHAMLIQLQIPSIDDLCQEPIMLAAAVDFGERVKDKSVWDVWTKQGGRRVMKYLLDHGSSGNIPAKQLTPDFAPAGKRAFGIVVPICSLTSRDDVQRKLSDPMIDAARRVGWE